MTGTKKIGDFWVSIEYNNELIRECYVCGCRTDDYALEVLVWHGELPYCEGEPDDLFLACPECAHQMVNAYAEKERIDALVTARYGTATPASIRDFWEV